MSDHVASSPSLEFLTNAHDGVAGALDVTEISQVHLARLIQNSKSSISSLSDNIQSVSDDASLFAGSLNRYSPSCETPIPKAYEIASSPFPSSRRESIICQEVAAKLDDSAPTTDSTPATSRISASSTSSSQFESQIPAPMKKTPSRSAIPRLMGRSGSRVDSVLEKGEIERAPLADTTNVAL